MSLNSFQEWCPRLSSLLHVLSCYRGKGCICLGGVILGDALVNYYLLEDHLGDPLSLSGSLILPTERGDCGVVH